MTIGQSRELGDRHRRLFRSLAVVTVALIIGATRLGPASAAVPTVAVADSATFGPVLTTGTGMALYTLDTDHNGQSTCHGSCPAIWPPLNIAAGTVPTGGPGVTGTVASSTQSNGTVQVTYNGAPVYTFVGDTSPGAVTGNNVSGFFVVKVAPVPSTTTTAPATTSSGPSAPSGSSAPGGTAAAPAPASSPTASGNRDGGGAVGGSAAGNAGRCRKPRLHRLGTGPRALGARRHRHDASRWPRPPPCDGPVEADPVLGQGVEAAGVGPRHPGQGGVGHPALVVIETLGDECIMFASDYPHWDGAWPHASAELLEHNQGRMSDTALARVAGANARRFYALP